MNLEFSPEELQVRDETRRVLVELCSPAFLRKSGQHRQRGAEREVRNRMEFSDGG